MGCLALSIGGAATGCLDAKRDSDDSSTALPMCGENGGPPANSVLVDHPLGAPCLAKGICQRSTIEGVAVSRGTGVPPEIHAHKYGWKDSETHWIKIDDAGRVRTIAAWNLPPFAVLDGSAVSASYFSSEASYSPDESALELRVGGQLAFYYGTAGAIENLVLPNEVEVRRGAENCKTTSGCLPWSEYDLEISVNGGEPVTLRTGETKVQHGYYLKNFRSASSTFGCGDDFVADTTLLVARRSLLYEEPGADAGSKGDAGL